jgi:hypothetical protein
VPFPATGLALLALALQGGPAPPLPVTIYPVLGRGRDSLAAARLTRVVAGAFRGDSTFVLVLPRPPRGSRMAQPRYGVVTELHTAAPGRLRLAVRIVDVPGVYLVARDSLTGSATEIERALPALARRAARRLAMLQWPVFSSGPPPSWLIPTDALRLYARALAAADRGDTTAAIASLRSALNLSPRYREACDALRRFGGELSCAR